MQRLVEPSTWAGVATLAQMLSAFMPPPWALAFHALTAAAGSVAVVMRERG